MTGRMYEYRLRRIARRGGAGDVLGARAVPASDVAALFRGLRVHDEREHFFVAHVDVHAHVVAYELTAIGTLNSVGVHPREVFRAAILAGASGIVLAHNHPSGDSTPSGQDDDLTKRLRDAGELLGIPVVDHVIVAERSYYSYAEHGRFLFDMTARAA